MDIKGLRYFIAAAERLNFTTAAKECYITQTAMSLHISKMETELGFKLFDRNKRVVELTNAGKDFLNYSRSLLQDYNLAVQHSTSIAIGISGRITIMMPSCLEGFVFMDYFKAFNAEYPEVELNIKVESPGQMVSELKRGRIDMAICAPYEMEIDPDIRTVHMREDPAIMLVSDRHPFAAEGAHVTAAMLEKETFIVTLDEATPETFRMIHKKWRNSGFDPQHFLGVKNMDEMLMLLEMNRGICIVPKFFEGQLTNLAKGIRIVDVEYENQAPILITAAGYLESNANPVLGNLAIFFDQVR